MHLHFLVVEKSAEACFRWTNLYIVALAQVFHPTTELRLTTPCLGAQLLRQNKSSAVQPL